MNDVETPVCPVCKTESIVIGERIHCVTCDRPWDGSESGDVDVFNPVRPLSDALLLEDLETVMCEIVGHALRHGRLVFKQPAAKC